ncbi:hypothetical protein V3C99_001090 [Haemonchus contortus]
MSCNNSTRLARITCRNVFLLSIQFGAPHSSAWTDMKLQQKGDVKNFETSLPVSATEARTIPGSTSTTTPNGIGFDAKVPTNNPTSFSAPAFGLPFAPNYRLAINAIPAQQSSTSNSARSKQTKSNRPPPCHHARYVLDEKPPRAAAANENMECTNCGTKSTSAWRRSAEGKSECNACNLFFRKNGRKRPASMRRDTIARRYRLSRCDLCAAEAQGGQVGLAQFQKATVRNRRNGKTSTKTPAQLPNDALLSSALSVKSEQIVSRDPSYFVAHPEFPPNFPPFIPPNVEYNHQNSPMMRYATDRPSFDFVNVEQPSNPLNDGQVCYARHSHSLVRSSDGKIYRQHLLVNPESGVQVEVCKRETVHEGAASSQGNVSSHDVNTHYEQLEQPTHQYGDFSGDKKVVKNELISSPRLENHCEGAYKIMMKEGTEDGFLTRSTSAPGALVETQHEDTPSQGNSFDLLGNTHEDENVLVFRSL